MLHHHASPILGDSVDSSARFYVRAHAGADIAELGGTLRGPKCEFARTLPAEYSLRQATVESNRLNLAEVLVTDPCYWTPSLPYLYELQLTVTKRSGETFLHTEEIGLRRWSANGRNLILERRRIVLRGLHISNVSVEQLQEARAADSALLVAHPGDHLCAEASRLGVMLLAVLTDVGDALADELARFSWFPAVMMVLVSGAQVKSLVRSPSNLIAQIVAGDMLSDTVANSSVDAIAVEIAAGESPPTMVASVRKPVIAIRTGTAYAEMLAARAVCDRLQAELSPEFDLAGYFVTP